MLTIFVRPLLLMFVAGWFPFSSGQTQEMEKVILVDVEVSNPTQAKKCFTPEFDRKKVELDVPFDDPMNSLPDFVFEEETLEGPDCFFPEMKIIYREYTYVVSLYCTSVIKYRNSKPYTPSNRVEKNDLYFTESVLDLLSDARKKYFGKTINANLAQKFVKNEPLDDDQVDDSMLYNNDEEENEDSEFDREIAKDAIDKDGIFDENKDPDLQLDELEDDDDKDDK